MPPKPVPIRIPENLQVIVDLHAKETRSDRSTVMRQWLWLSAELAVVKYVAAGKLTIGRAAELLDLTHYDIYRIAQENKIMLGASEGLAEFGRSLVGSSEQPLEARPKIDAPARIRDTPKPAKPQ